MSADGYHCLASQALWQHGLNRKRLKDESHTDLTNFCFCFWWNRSLRFFDSQLSICCTEGSTVLCAKITFTTKTWNRSPKTSRERHGKCKVWQPNHTLCVTPSLLHMHFNRTFIRIQPGAGICVTTNVRIVPELNPAGSPDPTPNNLHGWTKHYKKDHVDYLSMNSRSEEK